MNLSKRQKEFIIVGLNMRICCIETGDPYCRAVDVHRGSSGKIQALSSEQMKIIIESEELIAELYKDL